jgi:NAD(P)-dependent dehydrogenase (short-subunit alcohol dehydrogenase family)
LLSHEEEIVKLQNKVAIVTGGGNGIGRALVLRFAREGAQVVVADVDREGAEKTFADIGQRGLLMHTDISRISEIDALVDKTITELGHVDILVNNAGFTKSLGFFDVTDSDWDRMFAINTRAVFFCMQRVAREMIKRKSGKIINIASVAGKGARQTSNIAYASSKGAVIAMTRIGASQLASFNINVNSICPGPTRTPLFEAVMMKELPKRVGLTEEEAMKRLEAAIPLGRANTPDDVANLAAFLASAEADNITGQSLNVDGGLVWD